MDELGRAWAVLQLRPGSDIDEVRSSYRRLARRWHPDLHANDPRGQAEAAIQMKVLNAAYRRLLEAAAHRPGMPEPHTTDGPAGRRLSREEIDRLVAAIGTESWVESGLSGLPYWNASEWFRYRKTDNQWAITSSVVSGLAFIALLLVMSAFEWAGVSLSSGAGRYVGWGLIVLGLTAAHLVGRRLRE